MDNSDEIPDPEFGYQSPYQTPETELVQAETSSKPALKPQPRPLSLSGYFSWLVVGALTLGILSIVATIQLTAEEEVGGDAGPIDIMPVQLQGKFVVGQQELTKSAPGAPPTAIPAELDAGCYEQRICYSILLNEVENPSEALDYLEILDGKVADYDLELTEDQTRMREVVYELVSNYESGDLDSDSVPAADREFLKDKLDWVGELALYPAESPHQSERSAVVSQAFGLTIGALFAMMFGMLCGFAGFILSIVFLVMLFSGKLKSNFANHDTDHNIYIETFAIWISLFFGSSMALQLSGVEDPTVLMLLQPVIFFGSLLSLGWPVLRGVSFAQVRQDIGWTFQNPFKEISAAFGAYLALLPFLLPGLIMIVIIMTVFAGTSEPHEFARQSAPGHPIQEDIMSGNFVTICFVFLATCVAAPIVEETMFRGVLYRHLRDLTLSWQTWVSVAFSAVLNGLIFAAIHPQGMVAIPVLATLAIGFTLARQWRGSLLAPMTMHAIHNFLITCVSVLIL